MSECAAGAREALAALASAHGIEPEYLDADGTQRRVPEDTLRKLLASLGVAAGSVGERDLHRPLPAVHAMKNGKSACLVRVSLPRGTDRIGWQLDLEDRTSVKGEARFGDLSLLRSMDLAGRRVEHRRLVLNTPLPVGYHTLRLEDSADTCRVIVSPGVCWFPDLPPRSPRLWGLTAQLYLLRSGANWGIGDFSDLRVLLERARVLGAAVVGINPLHSLFPDAPEQASPYSPSTRFFLNVLNLDVTAIPGFEDDASARARVNSTEFQRQLANCQSASSVQYEPVAQLKLPVLRMLFESARARAENAEWRGFRAFADAMGTTLWRASVFQALREHFGRSGQHDWRKWPVEFRDPAHRHVVDFGREHRCEVEFHSWLQWQAERQLAGAAEGAKGMGIGLYRDLAVGFDPAGAECWSNPHLRVDDVQIGSPPDQFQKRGQDWGLAPMNPEALRAEGLQTFIELLRANMRHAGALRIDHAMSLQRLFWIPRGVEPTEGAYVRYPMEELLAVLAIESQRHRCVVIGEDLGTVPPGFRERMAQSHVLSYRVLSFEREADGRYLMPDAYPKCAVAVAGNHDLPTIRGWWASLQEQPEERQRLLEVLIRAGLLAAGAEPSAADVTGAIHAFLRSTPCQLALEQLDDWSGEVEPVNRPGTVTDSWRRRLSRTLDQLLESR